MESVDFDIVEKLVNRDRKNRYTMKFEPDESVHGTPEVWWIRANQGHSLKVCSHSYLFAFLIPTATQMVSDLELKAILTLDDIPTKVAVHGTTREAWGKIRASNSSPSSPYNAVDSIPRISRAQ